MPPFLNIQTSHSSQLQYRFQGCSIRFKRYSRLFRNMQQFPNPSLDQAIFDELMLMFPQEIVLVGVNVEWWWWARANRGPIVANRIVGYNWPEKKRSKKMNHQCLVKLEERLQSSPTPNLMKDRMSPLFKQCSSKNHFVKAPATPMHFLKQV